MKLWKISQKVNTDCDTYDSAIVAAETKKDAKTIRPDGMVCDDSVSEIFDSWCSIQDVKVKYLGNAAKNIKRGVVLSSYNAG